MTVQAGLDAESLEQRIRRCVREMRGMESSRARPLDILAAVEWAIRTELIERRLKTWNVYQEKRPKTVCYLSLEFLLGRMLRNNLQATGLLDVTREATKRIGHDLDDLLELEPDPGLGNGGLGRLAACYLDSLATLDYPAYGYGLRYDFGIFSQRFENGWQVEQPDSWLDEGCPWEVSRRHLAVPVRLGGKVRWGETSGGAMRPVWTGGQQIYGEATDILIAGYGTETVGALRLWHARAPKEFDFQIFASGDFVRAVEGREKIEAITKVLYPPDDHEAGRTLRLTQEYFLVACSVADILHRFRERSEDEIDWDALPDRVALQMNDTHPALAVAELMRVLLDEARLGWEHAWEITRAVCAYTNHTLLPEALEVWPVDLIGSLMPRHLQIIQETDRRVRRTVKREFPEKAEKLDQLGIIDHGNGLVRMAHLAIAGSHRINGVAQLHTKLLCERVVPDFAEIWPQRFVAVTNGITPRRWLASCNPALSSLVTDLVGPGWTRDLDKISGVADHLDDPRVLRRFLEIKHAAKVSLAEVIDELTGIEVDPRSIFDVHIKRLHEYKRQLLNCMHIIALYHRILDDEDYDMVPRTFIFGAKAAPAYRMAKKIIRLINGVAEVVNSDPKVDGRIKVIFLPDYRVSLAEKIIPAADVSEQTSTAGKEASGTGNMKLALNGALTVGTLDGANVEIRDRVGEDNIFIFGLDADEVAEVKADPERTADTFYEADKELARVVDAIRDGVFTDSDKGMLHDLWTMLMEGGDEYLHLADFRSYVEAQEAVDRAYRDRAKWAQMALANVAGVGYFSSDRAIHEYATKIWGLQQIPIKAEQPVEV